VLALLAAYVVAQRRRRRNAVRFAALPLLARVAPSPGWRRHLPAGLFLLMATLLVTGFARPEAETRVPREQATVVVALDFSYSMRATDVAPDRFAVAREAAATFVRELPSQYRVGLVPFSTTASVAVPPTTDHALVENMIRGLQPYGSTAIGDAIVAATRASQQQVAEAVAGVSADAGGEAADRVPARVVLLTDGSNSTGVPVETGIRAAMDAGVPVSTIAYGTDAGVIDDTPVPVDRETLRNIAAETGGVAYEAASAAELERVYDDLGSSLGFRLERTEITSWFVGLGLGAALLAALTSLRFTGRLP
jgi:Ca-activated chloride channel family protein